MIAGQTAAADERVDLQTLLNVHRYTDKTKQQTPIKIYFKLLINSRLPVDIKTYILESHIN